VLALVGVLVTCALAMGVVLDLLAARQRAADVADLAALAAVSAVLPTRDEACSAAGWVARRHAVTLLECDLVDGDARVVVSSEPRGPLAQLLGAVTSGAPEPRATARAGRR
jgi:secretion/DNA translocation related TadE-like protein